MVETPDDMQYLDRDRIAWNLPLARPRSSAQEERPDGHLEDDEHRPSRLDGEPVGEEPARRLATEDEGGA